MQEDLLKIGKYKIIPKGYLTVFKEIDFNIVTTDSSDTVLFSNRPLEWLDKKFHVTIYGKQGAIKRIELDNADQRYSMRYETMNDSVLLALQEENDLFLKTRLGIPDEKNMTGIKYHYAWGDIQSFYDNRSCQAGIVITFI